MKRIVRKIIPNRTKKIIRKYLPDKVLRVLSKIKFWMLGVILTVQMWVMKVLKPTPGTERWLVFKELEYGGLVKDISRDVVSDNDPRTPEQVVSEGMTGGDRMSKLFHGYADIYAKYLEPFTKKQEHITLLEVGILQGTGVAIWSDLFKNGRIIGLDIDLDHIKANRKFLESKGAFKNNNLELHQFDQYEDNEGYISSILKEDSVDVCIDDGVHYDEAILKTLSDTLPFLSETFVYFIEDNDNVYRKIKQQFPGLEVKNYGEMTVILSK
jgi:hypothetical protein